MLARIYPILAGDSDVAALVRDRIYRHGNAPQGTPAPYVTWSLLTGMPQNTLSEPPKVDSQEIQIDCWSDDDAQVEQLADAVRKAIEQVHHVTMMSNNSRDPTTMRYRIMLTITAWNHR